MKKLMLLSLFICLFIFSSSAQNNTESIEIPMEGITKVVLVLSGEVEIISEQAGMVFSAESSLFAKGDVKGWKFPKERPEFSFQTKREKNVLYVTTPDSHSPNVIGITTYVETIKNRIICPANVELIIEKGEVVNLTGEFQKITSNEVEKLNIQTINRSTIKTMNCFSQNLTIHGKNRNSAYEFEGQGTREYDLVANEIIISNF